MIERMNNVRRLMRACCRLLPPFLVLSFTTFAYSQERPSIFLDDLTWTELGDEIAKGKTTIIVPIGGTEQTARLWRSENTIGASSCFRSGLQFRWVTRLSLP